MNDLSMFFAQNSTMDTTEDFVVSDRFKQVVKDDEGEKTVSVPWKIRCMTEAENEDVRKSATKRVKVKGQGYVQETDPQEYLAKLVVASVVYPDLRNAELQKSYGVLGAENLLRKMLLPGEYANLVGKVQEINGFEKEMSELVDEVKN
ncbi:MAG TPA: phage portal protein [Bacilli bacterium]|nr:phage portal protein [Bacilli bacterium]